MPVETLTFRAEIGQLRKEIGKIPDITAGQAKKMTIALERQLKAAERASQKTQKALTRHAKKQADAMKDVAGDAARDFGKLGGLVGTIAPELENLTRFAVDAFDAIEVGAVNGAKAMAGIGVVVGAAALAYSNIVGEIELAAEVTNTYKQVNESLIPVERQLRDALLARAVALGELTEAQAAQEAAQNRARDAVLDFAKAQDAERERLQKSKASAEGWLNVLDYATGVIPNSVNVTYQLADAVFNLSDRVEAADEQLAALTMGAVEHAEKQGALRAATTETAEATEKQAKATERSNEATQQAIELSKQLASDLDELRSIRADAAASERSDIEKLIAAQNAQLDALDAIIERNQHIPEVVEEAYQAQLEVTATTEAQITEIKAAELAKREEQAAKALAATRAAEEAEAEKIRAIEAETNRMRVEGWENVASSAQATFGDLSSVVAGESKAAAKALFAVEKGLRAGEIILDGYRAATAALLPPPVGLGPVAGVGLASATMAFATAQAGLALAQPASFHTGRAGVAPPGTRHPDELVVRRDERMLTPQGVRNAGGQRAVDALNGGSAAAASAPMVAQFRFGHRVIDEVAAAIESRPSRATLDPSRGRSNPYQSRVS